VRTWKQRSYIKVASTTTPKRKCYPPGRARASRPPVGTFPRRLVLAHAGLPGGRSAGPDWAEWSAEWSPVESWVWWDDGWSKRTCSRVSSTVWVSYCTVGHTFPPFSGGQPTVGSQRWAAGRNVLRGGGGGGGSEEAAAASRQVFVEDPLTGPRTGP
jgi:hypothetical protein